jgi:hypothetical protein
MLDLLEAVVDFAARNAISVPFANQNIITHQIQLRYFSLHRIKLHQNSCEVICEHHEAIFGCINQDLMLFQLFQDFSLPCFLVELSIDAVDIKVSAHLHHFNIPALQLLLEV